MAESARGPIVFRNLPREDYPLHIEAYLVSNREVVWDIVVEKPSNIYIPGLASKYGEPIGCRVTTNQGVVVEDDG